MKQIPAQVLSAFKSTLDTRHIPENQRHHFVKWLRFYLDFCSKYDFELYDLRSLSHFIRKLQSKNQGSFQQQQATEAVNIGDSIGSAKGTDPKARLVAHLQTQLCQPSPPGQLRHPDHPRAFRVQRCQDHHDLYPYCQKPDPQRSQEPVGLLIPFLFLWRAKAWAFSGPESAVPVGS